MVLKGSYGISYKG